MHGHIKHHQAIETKPTKIHIHRLNNSFSFINFLNCKLECELIFGWYTTKYICCNPVTNKSKLLAESDNHKFFNMADNSKRMIPYFGNLYYGLLLHTYIHIFISYLVCFTFETNKHLTCFHLFHQTPQENQKQP